MDRTERLGLGISTAGHVLLLAAVSLGLLQTRVKLPPPPTPIDVSLADEVALQSASPAPVQAQPQIAEAPELGATEPDMVPPPPEESAQPDKTQIAQPPKPRALPPRPAPTPVTVDHKLTRTEPAKTASAAARSPAPKQPKAASTTGKSQSQATASPRASRLGADFLKGLGSDQPSPRAVAPTAGSNAPMGAVAARALNAEINRQIKPFWRPPSGADADKLVTLLSVHLDRDGAVVGRVEIVEQQGITPSNRAQADLHSERAVQAVMRASPFRNLPPEYYEQWKWLKPLRFDARLAQ